MTERGKRETGRFIRTNKTEEDSLDDISVLAKRSEQNRSAAKREIFKREMISLTPAGIKRGFNMRERQTDRGDEGARDKIVKRCWRRNQSVNDTIEMVQKKKAHASRARQKRCKSESDLL